MLRLREISSQFSATRAASEISESELSTVLKHLGIVLTKIDGPETEELYRKQIKDFDFW